MAEFKPFEMIMRIEYAGAVADGDAMQVCCNAKPVAKLVRCRECKHAKDENFISAIWCENLEKYLAYDFFCHDGERKDTDKGEQ